MKCKKIISFIGVIFAFALLITGCGKSRVAKIEVKENTMKTEYCYGEELDFSKLVINVTYENQSSNEIKYDGNNIKIEKVNQTTGTLSELNTMEVGRIKVRLTYEKVYTDTYINVSRKLVSIEYVSGLADSYYYNDSIDFSNIKIRANYNNNTSEEITYNSNNMSVKAMVGDSLTEVSNTLLGEQSIVITYQGMTATKVINIDKKLEGIEYVEGIESKYRLGASTNFSGVKVNRVYNDGSKELVTSGISVKLENGEEFNTNKVGNYTLVITLGEYTTTKQVTVESDVREIRLGDNFVKEFIKGQPIDFKGSNILVYFHDSEDFVTKTIGDEGVSVKLVNGEEFTTSEKGRYTLRVTYNQVYVDVIVDVKEVSSITIFNNPFKAEYYKGEIINFDGLVLEVSYFNNGEKTFEDETLVYNSSIVTITNFTTSTVGSNFEGSISYAGKSVDVTYNVREPKMVSISLKQGQVVPIYYYEDEINFSGLIFTVSKEDGSNFEVNMTNPLLTYVMVVDGEEVNFTKTVGDNILVRFKYEELSCDLEVIITDDLDRVYGVFSVDFPDNIVSRNANSESAVGDNKEAEFMNLGKAYYVGSANAFKFSPEITVKKGNGETITSISSKNDVSICIVDTNQCNILVGTDLNIYVTMNEDNTEFKFTTLANGKKFKLTLTPYYVLPEDKGYEEYSISLEVEIVDAYNVWNAKELGIINNKGAAGVFWESFLNLTNEQKAIRDSIKGIVIHDNINVTLNDIPSNYLTGNLLIDKYKPSENTDNDNWPSIYKRDVTNTTFNLYGNYFIIKADTLPYSDISTTNGVGHMSLFNFAAIPSTEEAVKNSKANIYDTFLIGNDNLNFEELSGLESGDPRYGGLSGIKALRSQVTIENSILRSFYINYYSAGDHGVKMTINNSKGYDAFQTMLFAHGGDFHVNNSELKRAGGPLAILRTVRGCYDSNHCEETKYEYHSNLYYSENSTLYSPITPNAPFFVKFSAQDIGTMVLWMNNELTKKATAPSSFATVQVFNVISLIIDGGALDPNATQNNNGKVVKVSNNDNGEVTETAIVDIDEGSTYRQTLNAIQSYAPGAPILRSSDGGYAIAIPPGLHPDYPTGHYIDTFQGATDNQANLYKGEYITLHLRGMAVTMAYSH